MGKMMGPDPLPKIGIAPELQANRNAKCNATCHEQTDHRSDEQAQERRTPKTVVAADNTFSPATCFPGRHNEPTFSGRGRDQTTFGAKNASPRPRSAATCG